VSIDKDEIRIFLARFKAAARRELLFPDPDRNKNLLFLAKQGLTAEERKEIILRLRVEDYMHGPETSDHEPAGPQNVWVFGAKYAGLEIFIRLRLVEKEKDRYALCFSFNEAEQPLDFPYKR
jgi:hypothetical protein